MESVSSAFQVHVGDNVATLLGDAPQGSLLTVIGSAGQRRLAACGNIAMGHKVALAPIGEGETIVKFGVVIGRATQSIEPGEWVHLHNCRSQLDERSGSFDLHTGAPEDKAYE